MGVFNDMYSRNFAALKAFTMTRYAIDGIWVPETMGWDGNADGTVGSDYTKNIYSTGTEAALQHVLQYAYTGDSDYLQQHGLPVHEGGREVLPRQAVASTQPASTTWRSPTPTRRTGTCKTRSPISPRCAASSRSPSRSARSSDLDAALRAQWQNILDNLVAYPTDATATTCRTKRRTAQNRNSENVACELIWPYSVTGIGAPDYARALSTWNAPAPSRTTTFGPTTPSRPPGSASATRPCRAW